MSNERLGAATPHEARKLRLVLIGAVAVPVLLALASCSSEEDTTPAATDTPTPQPTVSETATSTPVATPEFTSAPGFESLPQVPDEEKTSWQAILDYWEERQSKEHRLHLVENEKVRIDVDTGLGFEGSSPTASRLKVTLINPGSAEGAEQLKADELSEICTIVSPIIPQEGEVTFGAAILNSSAGPFEDPLVIDLRFTPEGAENFRTKIVCPVTTQ